MKHLLSLLFLAVVFSCEKKSFQSIESNIVVDSKGSPIDLNPVGLPFFTTLEDNLLIRNVKNRDTIFKVFNTEDFTLTTSFGFKGSGPKEFDDPTWAAQLNNIAAIKDTLYIYDRGRSMYSKISINDAGEANEVNIEFKRLPKGSIDYVQNIVLFNDSIFIYRPDEAGRLVIQNLNTGNNKVIGYDAASGPNIVQNNLWQVYTAQEAVNMDKKIIASAPLLLGQLDLFTFDGELISSTIYNSDNHLSPDISLEYIQKSELKLYCNYIASTANAIYLLVSNQTLLQTSTQEYFDQSQVVKFSWDGQFLAQYNLDHFATSIAVDEKRSKIYAYNGLVEENSVHEYSFE